MYNKEEKETKTNYYSKINYFLRKPTFTQWKQPDFINIREMKTI